MKLKVLPLDAWMFRENDFWVRAREKCLAGCEPIAALVHHHGIFKMGKRCWFELPDGRSFKYRAADFDYRMELLNAERYNAAQIAAMREAVRQRVATKEQASLVRLSAELDVLRGIGRSAKLSVARFRKSQTV